MKYDNHYKEQTEQLLKAVHRDIEKQNISDYKTFYPRRSICQNSYLHLLLSFFASQYGCSMEYAKRKFYKEQCNADLFRCTKVNNMGERFDDDLRSSADLSTAEMTLSIDRFRNWSAMEAGIYLPSPDEKQFLVYCENEIERNKEFI